MILSRKAKVKNINAKYVTVIAEENQSCVSHRRFSILQSSRRRTGKKLVTDSFLISKLDYEKR